MQFLIIAAFALAAAARPAVDVSETTKIDAIIESPGITEQRPPQPADKPQKNKQSHANQNPRPTLTIPTFSFVPLSIPTYSLQTFSMPTFGYNKPKNPQPTVYVPVYITTDSIAGATATRWTPRPAPPGPTWPGENGPIASSSTALTWNHESGQLELPSNPVPPPSYSQQPSNYVPPPSPVSTSFYEPTWAPVSPAVYVPEPVSPAVYLPTPERMPDFIVSQSIAPVVTPIMVTVTRGMEMPLNLGTLVPQAPKPKKSGSSDDDEDWR